MAWGLVRKDPTKTAVLWKGNQNYLLLQLVVAMKIVPLISRMYYSYQNTDYHYYNISSSITISSSFATTSAF